MTTDLDGRSVDRNIGRLATTRHVDAGRGSTTAIRWFGRDDAPADHPIDITYEMLEHRTNRFSGGLRRHGIEAGDRVATIAGRIPELYVAALGTLKAGCVFTSIPPESGPDRIASRLSIGGIRVVVTTPLIFRRSVAGILDRLPDLEVVLIVGATEDSLSHVAPSSSGSGPSVISFGVFISEGHDVFEPWPTPPGTPALLAFANRSTGAEVAVVHAHDSVIADLEAMEPVLASLVGGALSIVDEADFDERRRRRIAANPRVHADVL